MKCSNCNETTHDPDAVFCHNCGWPLTKDAPTITNGVPPGFSTYGPTPPAQVKAKVISKWLLIVLVGIVAVVAIYLLYNNVSLKSPVGTVFTQEHSAASFPQELSGNYMARQMNGLVDTNAAVKVYREGNGYAMNVYSSNITRKYTFTYNPSTGDITSAELGTGKVRIKDITNEIEITFTGWELLK